MAMNSETTVKKVVYLPKEFWERIEEYRFKNRHKSEAEAIRSLLEEALGAHERRQFPKVDSDITEDAAHVAAYAALAKFMPEHNVRATLETYYRQSEDQGRRKASWKWVLSQIRETHGQLAMERAMLPKPL